MPVHDALRHSGSARGIHDVKRVVEVDLRKIERLTGTGKLVPRDGRVQGQVVAELIQKRDHDNSLDAVYPFDYSFNRCPRIAGLSVVVIAVYSKQNPGFDLTEAIDHTIDAEVWRAGRPDGADTRCSEHGDHRLWAIGKKCTDAIASPDASGAESRRDRSDLP